MNALNDFIATGFFTGYLPKMPGTWGSIAAAIFWWFLPESNLLQTGVIFVGLIVGLLTSTKYVKRKNMVSDPSEVVIDEWVGMWISLLFIPHTYLYFIAGFLLFRLFDITKLLFISKLENLSSGIGIMADDVLAGIYSLTLLQLGVHLL